MSAANGYGRGIRPTNRSMRVGFSIGLGAKLDGTFDVISLVKPTEGLEGCGEILYVLCALMGYVCVNSDFEVGSGHLIGMALEMVSIVLTFSPRGTPF